MNNPSNRISINLSRDERSLLLSIVAKTLRGDWPGAAHLSKAEVASVRRVRSGLRRSGKTGNCSFSKLEMQRLATVLTTGALAEPTAFPAFSRFCENNPAWQETSAHIVNKLTIEPVGLDHPAIMGLTVQEPSAAAQKAARSMVLDKSSKQPKAAKKAKQPKAAKTRTRKSARKQPKAARTLTQRVGRLEEAMAALAESQTALNHAVIALTGGNNA